MARASLPRTQLLLIMNRMPHNLSAILWIAGCLGCLANCAIATPSNRPNVIVIITDDQGYGDLGVHGNPKIRTPNLDRLARQSGQLKHFYVSPVCTAPRA